MNLDGVVEVASADELRAMLGEPKPQSITKERKALHELDRQWLALSPFCLVATAGADGTCDVSPKGDPAGFTLVLDEATIAVPERPGNRRADGFRNILANPHIGLLYFIPGRTDTLRINGRARLVKDAPFFDEMRVKGHRPQFAVIVEIEQVFHHCAKAFMRAQLWSPQTWRPDAMAPRPVIAKTLEQPHASLEVLQEYYGASYADQLYCS